MEFRLKSLRKSRKISQLKLALDLNMNQNTISRYENKEREADYEALIKIADYFDVDSTILRIIYVLLSIFVIGCPVIIYLIVALIIPEEPETILHQPDDYVPIDKDDFS